MPRRSTKKRKAASSSVGDGQGASKQQGGKRKSAPAPAGRQTSPLATVLTPDTLGRSLSFLDVPSLVRSEMTAKFIQGSAVSVWAKLDKKIGADEKVDGDSARDRVIRSSPQYRHHLLAEYAAKVEMMKPANTETIQRGLRSTLSKDLDFYVRFARVSNCDSMLAEYEGSRRKGKTTFLAGGVFTPDESMDAGNGRREKNGFDLTDMNLGWWPLLRRLIHSLRGGSFINERDGNWRDPGEDLDEALDNVTSTIVAINRKTLALSIVMASDSHYCIDGAYCYHLEPAFNYHTQGTMDPPFWEGVDEEDADADDCRFVDYLLYEDRFKLLVR